MRAALSLTRLVGRVRQALLWRALYAAFDRPWVVRLSAGAVRRFARKRGFEPDALVAQAQTTVLRRPWPSYPVGWINVDVMRFLGRVRRELRGATFRERIPPRRPSPQRLRVGVVGAFVGLLSFGGKRLFVEAPMELECCVFDLEWGGSRARYLEDAASYTAFREGVERAAEVAAAVSAADLDLVILIHRDEEEEAIIDGVVTRLVGRMCTGSNVSYHPRADFSILGQPQADYPIIGRQIYSARARRWVTSEPILHGGTFYDDHGLDPATALAWRDRESLIVVHGSLYKLAASPFRSVLFDVLDAEPGSRLEFAGRGTPEHVEEILGSASARGLADRVTYLGGYTAERSADDGLVMDAGQAALFERVGRARLAPDPFPLGGGSTRAEVYGLGAPSVHMGVRLDAGAWGRPQDAVLEIERLRVPEATAYDVDSYRALCLRCLRDEAFADTVAERQRAIFARVTDPRVFWAEVMAFVATVTGHS